MSPSTTTLLALLALAAAGATDGAAAPPPLVNVTPTGAPVIVWAATDTLRKCGFVDVPDIPARAFVDTAGRTHVVCGSTTFRRMEGSSALNVTRNCTAAFNETADPRPWMFAGDEFLDSTWAFANGTVVSLIHTEYPGNVYKNCTGPAYPHCWTVTIGLAISHDFGVTWAHARPPPAHLVAAVPYGYNQSQLAYGWGDPSNIFAGLGDGYYYAAIWNRNQVGLQEPGVCMMRTNDLTDPAAWRAWSGAAYDVPFASPYTLPPGGDAAHLCRVTNLPNCPMGSIVFSSFLNAFIASMDCSLQGGSQFYFATSTDLISWSAPTPFYNNKNLPANVSAMVTAMSYPAFLDLNAPASGDRNFATAGQFPWLTWASIGHSPYSDGRHLWATPMRFDLPTTGGRNGALPEEGEEGAGADGAAAPSSS